MTANEGDAREYFFAATQAECQAAGGLNWDEDDGCLSFNEDYRVEDLVEEGAKFSAELTPRLAEDALGRLKVTIPWVKTVPVSTRPFIPMVRVPSLSGMKAVNWCLTAYNCRSLGGEISMLLMTEAKLIRKTIAPVLKVRSRKPLL